jgi:uncharacterized protein
MHDRWASIGRLLSRRTIAASVAVVLISAGMVLGVRQLDFATGQDSYIDPSSQVAKDNRRYQDLFGGESMVVLFTLDESHDVVDLFTPANVAQLDDIQTQLQNSAGVHSVVSPLTLLQWTHDLITSGTASEILARTIAREPDVDLAELRRSDALITTMRLGAAGEQDLANPDWVKFLMYDNVGFSIDDQNQLVAPPDSELVVRQALRAFIPDPRHAIFATILTGNASLDQLAEGSDAVNAVFDGRTFENATVTITGTPTFLTDINEYLQGGMLSLGGIAVLVMLVILLVAFKVRWRLLPLLGMAVGIVWAFGSFGFTGTDLSLVTISGLPILIGLGIEFAIQVQNRIEEERPAADGDAPFATTLRRMGPPLLAATMAAVFAFLTVKISKVPMVQDFGILLAIGIVALLVTGVVVPTMLLGARERRSPTTKQPREGWVERSVLFLGGSHRRAVVPFVIAATVLPVLGLALEGGSKIESDPINWADQSSESITNARLLEEETGFATTLGVFIEADSAAENAVFTDQMGAFVVDLVGRSRNENTELAEASSLATTVAWLAEVPGTTPLPPTGLDMLQAYLIAPPVLQGLLVADNANAMQVLFQVGPSSLEQRAEVLNRVEGAIADPGAGALLPAQAAATPGGLAVVGVGLLENITANRAQLTITALLLVGAFVMIRYRDLVRGLLTMIPVLLAVGTSALIVRALGITLSPLTTVGGPLVVATCAEFCVLLIARYAEERARGLDPAASTSVAGARTGRAFFTSALTTLGGFAVLMLSSLPLLADFGMVVTINIAVALLAALVIVPPLVKEADVRGLLMMDPEVAANRGRAKQSVLALASGAIVAAIATVIIVLAVDDDPPVVVAAREVPTVEVPATLPPPTTAAPSTTAPPPGDTLPAGPTTRPDGLVAGAFWDALVAADVDPGVARCAADDLLATTSEADLLALGIAAAPRPAEVNALLEASATKCGVTPEQLEAAATPGA